MHSAPGRPSDFAMTSNILTLTVIFEKVQLIPLNLTMNAAMTK